MIQLNLLSWREIKAFNKNQRIIKFLQLLSLFLLTTFFATHFYFFNKIEKIRSNNFAVEQDLKVLVQQKKHALTSFALQRMLAYKKMQKIVSAVDCLGYQKVHFKKITYTHNQSAILGDFLQLNQLLRSINECNHHADYFAKINAIFANHAFLLTLE